MKKIYYFKWDQGRNGIVDSLFIADSEIVEQCIGKDVWFGEILGKHSEVFGTLEEKDFKVIPDEPGIIAWFEKNFPVFWRGGHAFVEITGYCPLLYVEE